MRSNTVIAIGCFYKVEVPEQADGTAASEELILIGVIFSKIERETERNEVMIEFMDEPRWNVQSWFERAREFFSCGVSIPCRRSVCYIMTIGVIDELRQMGIGSKMLNYTIDLVEKRFTECICIYLHVVDYNISAIKFYQKNQFLRFRRMKRHYTIDGRDYDAIVLYKPIGRLRRPDPEPILEKRHGRQEGDDSQV